MLDPATHRWMNPRNKAFLVCSHTEFLWKEMSKGRFSFAEQSISYSEHFRLFLRTAAEQSRHLAVSASSQGWFYLGFLQPGPTQLLPELQVLLLQFLHLTRKMCC